MFNLLLVFLLVFSASHSGTAQQTPPSPAGNSVNAYPDEAAVVERDEVIYRYNDDGTGSKTETTAVRIQSGAALQSFAVLGFPYASETEELDIVSVRVHKPDGTTVETPTTDAQEQPALATQAAPMYSDLRIKQLPVRSLAVGDTLEMQTRTVQKKAEIPGQFWGAENFGVGLVYLDRRIELHVPKSKAVAVYSPKYPPETVDSGAERVYRWKGAQLRRSNAKDEDAPQDKLPPIAWTTFGSWEAVGAWYQGLIAGRDAVTPALQAKADEVTQGAKTDTDKVRALYEYVSQHNHYIGVDFGIGRYQPHAAAEVLANQYGDCKDKHTLLAALLRAKGFQPSAVLIEKVPSPAAFNHLITMVDVDGGPVWLDATTEVAPYRVLLPVLRDKQALVVPAKSGPGVPRLTKTPLELPFAAVDHYEGTYTLAKDGTTKGNMTLSMRGDTELIMRYANRQIARAQWDQFGQVYVGSSGFSGKASNVVLDADDLSRPWTMRYEYTQEAWSEWKNYRIGPLLPTIELPVMDEKNPPKEEIDLSSRRTQTAKSTIHLPGGYSAELPNAVHLKTTFATFDETYRLADGALVSEYTLEVLKPKVEASEWKHVKEMTDAAAQPWIQVTRRQAILGEAGPPAAGETNEAAADLVRQAYVASTDKDWDLAQKKIDQAIALNDKQAYAWALRGWLALQKNHLSEAAAAYERELHQHPNEVDQYPALIRLERLLKRTSEYRTYLLAYAKAAPDNPQAVLLSGGQLLAANNVDDAVAVYRAGVQAIPDNRLIQVELGRALLRAGNKDEAVALLRKALDGSSDPEVLNDAAYELLSGGPDVLPLAETDARKAVEILETQSAATTLDSANLDAFRANNLMLAAWDTLGWVYYNEGKDAPAEAYVRASWRSAQHAEEGLHMGKILERKGDRKEAMRVYEMALSQAGNAATPVANELHDRVNALQKAGIATQSEHPAEALQQQRIFRVARPSGVKGSGTFFMQVSADGTKKAEMAGGDEALRALGDAVQKLDLGLTVPSGSHALLLRSGVLICAAEPTCELTLVPPENAGAR